MPINQSDSPCMEMSLDLSTIEQLQEQPQMFSRKKESFLVKGCLSHELWSLRKNKSRKLRSSCKDKCEMGLQYTFQLELGLNHICPQSFQKSMGCVLAGVEVVFNFNWC